MRIKTVRQGQFDECDYLVIEIGDSRYRIEETLYNELIITKNSDGDSDMIDIRPIVGNQIKLT